MSFLNIEENQTRVFYNEKYNVSEDMTVDVSTMNKDVEDNMSGLIKAAKMTLSKKKPIYDFKTKNKSFLNLYNDLYKLGIVNNKFFLILYDKDLIGVDPYQRIMPLDLQMKIFLECIINPWYFLREICRIPEDGKPIEIGGGTQYQIDRNNAATWYLFLNGIDHYSSKPRQTGKTQDALAKCNYAYHFGTLSAWLLFFNKDQTFAKANLYRMKCQRDMMPAWMQMKIKYEEDSVDKGQDNMTGMRNPITSNSVFVMPKATGKESAVKLGRGATAAIQYYDEFDFMPFNIDIINAASFAYSRSSENAAANKSLYGRIYTSTPGDLDTRDGKAATDYVAKMLKWRDEYLDLPINQLKKIIKSPGYNGIVFVEHTWRQLKKSMEWYEKQCQLVSYSEDVILREIDLQRIHGTSSSPFKRSDLIYLAGHKKEPLYTLDYSKNLCPILVYEELHRDYPYILAIDPSEGLSQDNNAMTLINPYTLCPVAEFKSPYISPSDFVKLAIKFMDDKCPNCLIVPEANKREVVNRFLESKYKYRLYYDIDKLSRNVVENTDEYGAQKHQANERRAFGFDTTTKSRVLLFDILENLVEEQKDKLYGKFIVEDILALERKTSGKIESSSGNHDDNIISYLIGLAVYYHASNLEDFGIHRGASEPITSRPPTMIETREKIKSVLSLLPESMREFFNDFTNQKDPTESAEEYEKNIQFMERTQDIEQNKLLPEEDSRFIEPQVVENQWNSLSNDVFESNFRDNQDVDISKYVE